MPANTQPIFPLIPRVSWGTIKLGNTATDGTGGAISPYDTNVILVFTAGANGSRIDQIKVRSLGTNVATVLRFYVNTGGGNSVFYQNSLIHETTIAATTASNTLALVDNLIVVSSGATTAPPIPYLQANDRIIVTIGTAVAAGLQITVHGGDY